MEQRAARQDASGATLRVVVLLLGVSGCDGTANVGEVILFICMMMLTIHAGAAAPILGYGALNALLFVAYNRSLLYLSPSTTDPTNPTGVPLHQIWAAGAVGGLASWFVSSPTELVKCRAQLSSHESVSSWKVARDVWRSQGPRGFYFGGAVTSIRDAVGYGF